VIGIQSNPSAPPSWLQPHEEIVWVGQTQYGNRGWGGGLVVTLFGALLATGGVLGSSLGFILVGALFFLVGAPLTYAGIKQGGTRFYLTSFRLVRARRGAILNQISRQIFRGKNLATFLRVTQAPSGKYDKAWVKVVNFHVDVLDPNSGDVLMSLGWVPAPSVQALETIGQVVYCQYCGRSNPPSNNACSECGASL
jgi:hypothetical protein